MIFPFKHPFRSEIFHDFPMKFDDFPFFSIFHQRFPSEHRGPTRRFFSPGSRPSDRCGAVETPRRAPGEGDRSAPGRAFSVGNGWVAGAGMMIDSY